MPEKNAQVNTDRGLPYERFLQFGPENLTEAELLAVILRTGTKEDSALALDLHEVRRGAFLDLVAFDRPGDVDGTAEEQQLFGEGGFTRVGVGDDREGAAACDFFL